MKEIKGMATSLSILLPIFLTFFVLLLSKANSTETFSFSFTNFTTEQQNLVLQGDAAIKEGRIELTKVDEDSNAASDSIGRVLFSSPVHLWDSTTGKVAKFSTYFSFIVYAPNKTTSANGLAFFLSPVNSEPQSSGGYLGLFNSKTYNKDIQTVAIEFDTFSDDWDPSNRHIGIDVNSIKSIKTSSWGLANGQIATVLVTYNPSTNLIVASLVHPSRRTSYIISAKVVLKDVLSEWVSIGFSASTGSGAYVEKHNLISWSFTSTLSDGSCDNDDPLQINDDHLASVVDE